MSRLPGSILIPLKFNEFRGREICGGKGIRTPDLLIANETLYQLSYTPAMAANYHDDTIRHQAKRLVRLRSKLKAHTPFPENLSSGLASAGLVARPVEENAPDLVHSLRLVTILIQQ